MARARKLKPSEIHNRAGVLTDKADMFCREYLVDLNSAAAARRAGYDCKNTESAASVGFELLQNKHVRARTQTLMDERSKRVEIDSDRVLHEVARIAFSDIRQMFDEDGAIIQIPDLEDDVSAALASVKVTGVGRGKLRAQLVEFKVWDKLKALELLGKHLKLFKDTTSHEFPDGIPEVITRRVVDPSDGYENPAQVEA
ncbi:MAG: terminase small subunit [Pseudomonadota bacterium]